jgi:hypothetical protein
MVWLLQPVHDMRYTMHPPNGNTRSRPTRSLLSHVKAPGEPLPRATDDAPMPHAGAMHNRDLAAQSPGSERFFDHFELFAVPRQNRILASDMVTIPSHSVSPVVFGGPFTSNHG